MVNKIFVNGLSAADNQTRSQRVAKPIGINVHVQRNSIVQLVYNRCSMGLLACCAAAASERRTSHSNWSHISHSLPSQRIYNENIKYSLFGSTSNTFGTHTQTVFSAFGHYQE